MSLTDNQVKCMKKNKPRYFAVYMAVDTIFKLKLNGIVLYNA